MRPFAFVTAVLTLFAVSVRAQTVTTIDELGQTVVEAITIDPIQGLPITQTLQTLTTTSTATTVPNEDPQGPVGQPQATQTAGGPTPFTYTTVDAAGDTQIVVATFTPSSQSADGSLKTPPPGTVLDYSSWIQAVGTNTVPVLASAATSRWALDSRWLGVGAALCAGFTSGALLVLA